MRLFLLRITIVEEKIVVTLESGGEDPIVPSAPYIQDHNYTMVGEFNSWGTSGIDLEFDAKNNNFFISYYDLKPGKDLSFFKTMDGLLITAILT